jgi:hypothetical protein
MTAPTFLTPRELGRIKTKPERLQAVWTDWIAFLAKEGTETLLYQLADPTQGKCNRSDIEFMLSVYRSLREATHRDPTATMSWAEAKRHHQSRLRAMKEEQLETAA